jgi:hypothetical protein
MTSATNHGHEHEFEPEFGLPERLPITEKLIWQTSPSVLDTAIHVFHLRKLVLYFTALGLIRIAYLSASGTVLTEALASLLLPFCLALVGMGATFTLAWLTARNTVYTLTDQRIVMRIGIVLTLTYNFPLKLIDSAGIKINESGTGDIPLVLKGDTKIAIVHLWPHARAWKIAKPEPMLRCLPDVAQKAKSFAQAWSKANGVTLSVATIPKNISPATQWNASLT